MDQDDKIIKILSKYDKFKVYVDVRNYMYTNWTDETMPAWVKELQTINSLLGTWYTPSTVEGLFTIVSRAYFIMEFEERYQKIKTFS